MRNKINAIVAHGFNRYFDVPMLLGKQTARFRTALVIKKTGFYDHWATYDSFAWRVFQHVSDGVGGELKIQHRESTVSSGMSLKELKDWQANQAIIDPSFSIDPPIEIHILKDGVLLSLVMLEDWSDIGMADTYACSYTFSFYSCDSTLDALITNSIFEQLSHDPETGDIKTVWEHTTPRRYWKVLNVLQRFLK